jgi:hypothetical protein
LAQSVIDVLDAYRWQDGPGLFGYYTTKNRRNLDEGGEARAKPLKRQYNP